MQRYFVTPEQIVDNTVRIQGSDVHHMYNVMRYRVGDEVICCDGKGMDHRVKISMIRNQEIELQIQESVISQGEPQVQITLAQSLPKGDKWDWILQKSTELGAYRFLPFTSLYTIVKIASHKSTKKQERWQRIVKEAAEQSHRGHVPIVENLSTWSEILQAIQTAPLALIAYEKGGQTLSNVLANHKEGASILVLIGPEGGFAEEEVADAVAAGAIPITLGKRIMRTETASLATLSCILYAKNELGGE